MGGTQQAQGLFRSHSRSHLHSVLLLPEARVETPAARMCHPVCTEGAAENEHAISFPPWAHPQGKVGRQEHFYREIQSSLSQIVPWCTVRLQKGASDPGADRNGPASMPVRAPTCGTRPRAVGAVGTGLLVLWFLPGD